jgi:hypothetical protein
MRVIQLLQLFLLVLGPAPKWASGSFLAESRAFPSPNDERVLNSDQAGSQTDASNTKQRSTRPATASWAFLLPLVAMSFSMWVLKHGQRCCSGDTVMDDSIPFEIVVERKEEPKPEDIELQQVVASKAENHMSGNDPVQGLSMLNCSDWTEDELSKDNSFSWMENGSTVEYMNMKD